MTCDSARDLLTAYVDRELDVARSLEIEDHLGNCAGCARVVRMQQSVRAAIQAHPPAFELPRDLESRIARKLPGPPRTLRAWHWMAAAAAVILAIVAVRELPRPPAPGDVMAQEIFDSHLRSLQPGHLTDVESSDRHTVKPWFNGKLDFSPPIFDLSDDGFPLVGGRLDSIEGRAVAALVYRRAKHEISLYLWPDREVLSGSTHVANGYNMIQWNDRGFSWWLISDLNPQELKQFQAKLKASR